ncbi:MAG TPA: RDD family protein [Chitinophagaceae bacterium]|nr:RDD family protein [Chitinophagaceae bacterium]
MNPVLQEALPAEATKDVLYASLSDRVKSIFADTLFIVILMFIFVAILNNFDNPPDWVKIAVFITIWLLYEPVCVVLGCTIGQYMMNIRVRRVNNTAMRINIFQSYIRYIIKVALGWISFLFIASGEKRQALHDLAVGSVMIKL